MKVQIAYCNNSWEESFSTRLVTEAEAADYLSAIVLAAILCQEVESNHERRDLFDMNVYFDGIYQRPVIPVEMR